MENLKRRGLSLLLALVMIVSLFAGIQLPQASAATVDYVYSGDYVYNWGTRGTTATYLSPMAEAWYSTQGTSYDALSALSGSSTESSVPSSALYKELQSLMGDAQTYTTSYEDTKTLFQYTDCENSGGKISSFYSGNAIGPSWDGNWNREHTWPNSKGDAAGSGEDDIMMLRPTSTSTSENSSRGNTAYGQSSGYYNPNSESSTYDLRGDVARIILFVYVRWNCTNTGSDYNPNGIFGTDGVFESKAVLLDWMEEDPVDTWELGRNDSVQSITGTRNVFVDYPELGFLLFGAEIPANYSTPSGEGAGTSYAITATSSNTAHGTVSINGRTITATPADGYYASGYTVTSGTATVTQNGNTFAVTASSDCNVQINFAAKTAATITFMENGVIKKTVNAYQGDTVKLVSPTATPDGYTFLGWVTEEVQDSKNKPSNVYKENTSYTLDANTTFYALYTYVESSGSGTGKWTLVTDASKLTAGAQLVIAYSDTGVVAGTYTSTKYFATSDATFATGLNTITELPDDVVIFTLGGSAGAWTLANSEGTLLGSSSKNLKWGSGTNTWTISIASGGTATIANTSSSEGYLQYNVSSPRFKTYADQTNPQLYMMDGAAGTTYYTTSTCDHTDTTTTTVKATCTADGSTTVTCNDCGAVISETTISATGHNYVNGTCTGCGKAEATGNTFELVTSLDALVNGKYVLIVKGGAESSNGAYYAMSITPDGTYLAAVAADNYMGTTTPSTIEVNDPAIIWAATAENGTLILSDYSGNLLSNSSSNNLNMSTSGTAWTVTLVEETNTFTLSNGANDNRHLGLRDDLTGDPRFRCNAEASATTTSYQFYLYVSTTACAHGDTTTVTEDATCTEDGQTTVTCNDCDKVIYTEVLEATDHDYENGVCNNCGDNIGGNSFKVTFAVPNGVTKVEAMDCFSTGITLPTAESPEGYTFLGWVETKINNATTEPTFYARESNFVATKATTLYALYTYSIGGEGGKTITFELGENESATHSDGKDLTEAIVFTADDGVTMLSFTGITKAYHNAFDAKGNSALKFGTGSAVGSVTFAVPDNVTEVQLLVAGYKTATVGITVNGNAQTISTTSDNGAYTTVQVDTTGTKSVTFTTTTNKRAMMDAIKFIVPGQDAIYYTTELCLHINTTTVTDKATCTEEGRETITCDDCDAVLSDTILPAIGHNHVSGVCANCGDTKYISFVTPEGVEKISAIIAAGADIELPEANVSTGEHEYTFVGWSKTPIDNTDSYGGTVYTTTDTSFTSNTTLYAVYTYVETIGGEGGSTTTSEILFNLGANGTATHKDGSTDKATYSQTNGEYTLSLTGGSKMYPSSYDAKGNSCIKLGTGSAAGKFSFTVPDDVKSVEIHVAKYKANTSKVTINGTTTTLTKASNNGEYDVITVDTSTTKTVSVTTVSGGYRAMVNTIVFVVEYAGGSEPEDVTFHTTVITDACTHTKTTTNTVAPTTTTEGTQTVICDDCGATVSHTVLPKLKFTAASLEVGEGISINFKVPANMFAEGMYDLDSVVATFTYVDHPEDSFTVTQPILKNDNWIFQLKNIRPDWMGDDVTATISATFNGEEVTGTVQTIEYSIAEYCYKKLETETAETRFSTLLVDMLNYGAATQLHTGYKTDALVNADLTDAQKGWGSDTTKTLTNVQGLSGEAGSVSWKGAALFLRETTRIRLRFAAEDVTGLTVVATVGGNSYELTNFISAGNGQYYVFFDNLLATQMRDNVEFTVMDGDAAVSKTLTYSVASYAAAVSESNTTLYNMIHAMMRYGDSVDVYAG